MKEHAGPIFEWLQENCRSVMTLVDELPFGTLYYYEQSGFSLPPIWVCLNKQFVLVAYSENESRQLIGQKLERWVALLKAERKPESFEDYSAVFAASRDEGSDELRVGWIQGGDWMGLVGRASLLHHNRLLPRGWPESYRERIEELSERQSFP